MPDRSDDIKQLFSHLGLNPGQYHELQERTRAVTPPPPAAAPPAPMPAPAAPAKPAVTHAEPKRVVAAPPPPSPPPPQTPPLAPVSAPPPVVAAPVTRVAAPVPEAPVPRRRATDSGWPLIRAAQETPTRIAQVPAPTSPPESSGSTRRLINEISRHRDEGIAERLAAGASKRWREPLTPPATPITPEPPVPVPEEPLSRLAPDSDLAQTFQRIAQPERTPLKRDARLRFSYDISDDVSRTRRLKEENLEQVFDRLSGEAPRRGPGSTESQ